MSYNSIEVAQIVAISTNRCIGKDNDLPWHIPEDLAHFKSVTISETDDEVKGVMVMGRKTFESMGSKALPKRKTIVVTSNTQYDALTLGIDRDKVVVAHSLSEALSKASEIANAASISTIWIVGGERLFTEAMEHTDRIELTQVHTCIESGDAFYPSIPLNFNIVKKSRIKKDEKSNLNFYFSTYIRN